MPTRGFYGYSANVVDERLGRWIEKDERDDLGWAAFGDFPGFIESGSERDHAGKIDLRTEADGGLLAGEAGEAVDAIEAVAAVGAGGGVVQHDKRLGEFSSEA